MFKSVLNDTGEETLDNLSYQIYHGEDVDFNLKSTDSEKVEKELRQNVESKGFDYVIPSGEGGGTARQPFLIPDNLLTEDGRYVVKFARYKHGGRSGSEKGRIQNHCEVLVWDRLADHQRQKFVPIRDYDENYFWLVMDFAKCFDSNGQRIYDPDDCGDFAKDLEDIGVRIDDFDGSFGEHEGDPKCLDYGLDAKWNDYGNAEKIVNDDEWGDYDTDQPAGMI